jgi:hypothetical protein
MHGARPAVPLTPCLRRNSSLCSFSRNMLAPSRRRDCGRPAGRQVIESTQDAGEPLSFEIGAGEIMGNPIFKVTLRHTAGVAGATARAARPATRPWRAMEAPLPSRVVAALRAALLRTPSGIQAPVLSNAAPSPASCLALALALPRTRHLPGV